MVWIRSWFSSRLVNEMSTIVLVHAGMQANQFASAIDSAGSITNFTANRTGKSFFFFSQDSKETCYLIFVSVIRKRYIRKTSHLWKQYICMFSLKAQPGKRTATGTCIFSSICIKLVNIKNNSFEHALYLLHIVWEEK